MSLNSHHYSPGFRLIVESKDLVDNQKEEIIAETKRISINLEEMEPKDRLLTAIQGVEAYNNAQLKGVKVSCGAGCTFCCYTPVTVSETEVDLLVEHIKETGMVINESDLKSQAQKAGDLEGFWSDPVSPSKCVFLGDGNKCNVYEKRPIACRLHFVTSHPDACKVGSGDDVKKYAVTNSEIVATAYYQTSRIGYLPEILYNKLYPGSDIHLSAKAWNKLVNGEDVIEEGVSYEAALVEVEADSIKMVSEGILGYYGGSRKIKLRTN